ncbi:MAG: hypothetical protein U0Q12_19240 [Vicinamibacterales bacterium]
MPASDTHRLDRPPSDAAIVGLMCVGLFVLNWALNGGEYLNYLRGPVRFDAEAGRLARSLVEHGTFGDPFGPLPTGPSTHLPPLFPLLFAAVIQLQGVGPDAWNTINIIGGSAVSAWIALLPLAARRLGISPWAGLAGGLAAAVANLRHFPEWDANLAGALLVLLTIAAAPGLRGRPSALRRSSSMAVGLLWALVLHVNATTLVLFATWTVGLWIVWRERVWRTALVWSVALPVALLVPWTVRNWYVFDRPILLRGNLGLELATSHNACASPGLLQTLESGCFAIVHPDLSLAEAVRMRDLGEPAYHAARLREATSWIAGHPGRTWSLTLRRIVLFWWPSPRDAVLDEWWTSTPPRRFRIIAVATLLSVVGLLRLFVAGAQEPRDGTGSGRAAWVAGLVLAAPLLLFPIVYYLLQFEDRYRYPILWVTFLLAGHALVDRARRFRASPDLRRGEPRHRADERTVGARR